MCSLAARAAPVGLWMLVMVYNRFCRRLGSILAQACSYHFICSVEKLTAAVDCMVDCMAGSLVAGHKLFGEDVRGIGAQLDQPRCSGIDHRLRAAEIGDRVGTHIALAQRAD